MTGKRINDEIFIYRIIVRTGGAVQAAANSGQHVAQEVERLRPIAGDGAKRFPLARFGNQLAAIVFADLQFVVFRREAIILIAIR